MSEGWFVPDEGAIDLFRSWQGALGQSFARLERETVFRQKALMHKKTGKLAGDITSKHVNVGQGNIAFDAGSFRVRYAAAHELGSRPHVINAKNSPVLVFFWPKVGHVVAFKSVHHPAVRGYHELTQGAQAAMRMWERGG